MSLAKHIDALLRRFGGHFHWSKEGRNEDKPGIPWRGRAWFHLDEERRCITLEWAIKRRPTYALGASLSADHGGDHEISVAGYLWPVAVYVSFEGFLKGDWYEKLCMPKYGERELELVFAVEESTIRWNFWTPSNEWHSKTPKYRNGHLNIADFLLGPVKYSRKEVEKREVMVPMPERFYRGTATREVATWERPRWPFPTVLSRVDIDLKDDPIPCPGKGENSWDCDDDATYSMSTPARTIEQAIGIVAGDALETRRKRGGPMLWDRPFPPPRRDDDSGDGEHREVQAEPSRDA